MKKVISLILLPFLLLMFGCSEKTGSSANDKTAVLKESGGIAGKYLTYSLDFESKTMSVGASPIKAPSKQISDSDLNYLKKLLEEAETPPAVDPAKSATDQFQYELIFNEEIITWDGNNETPNLSKIVDKFHELA